MASTEHSTSMVIFERLAQLLMPADGDLAARAFEAAHWEIEESDFDGVDAGVWGRAPLRSGAPRVPAARAAVRRESSLFRLKRGFGSDLRVVAVHRWFPADLRTSGPRRLLKRALLGGALAELTRGSMFARRLDAASAAAGFGARVHTFRPGSGGSVRAESGDRPGELMRAGAEGSPVDPGWAADALVALEAAGVASTPRLIRRGRARGASWSVETMRPGTTPDRLTARLLTDSVVFCCALPKGSDPPASLDADLEEICSFLPKKSDEVRERLEPARAVCAMLPSVARHGDLWAGNLLEGRDGEIQGVLDWDAWHPLGVPGADLLHLYAWDRARQMGLTLGQCWSRRPWLDDQFEAVSERYWKQLDVRPAREVLDAVGLAWWSNQVAQSLRRLPHLAAQPDWVEGNVDTVVRNVT